LASRRSPSRALCTTIFVALGIAAGCAPPKVGLGRGPREYVWTDYQYVLDEWTRKGSVVDVAKLDSYLSVTATYESWDFRWAYAVRYSQDYRLTVDQRKVFLDGRLAETDKTHQFYVTVAAERRTWADLTRPDAAWIVRLVDDHGNETAPTEIELVRRPSAIERTYFPDTTAWRTAHRVRFPVVDPSGQKTIADDATWFGLRFAGAQGNSTLVWEVEGRGDAPNPDATK
jgi:hypothetical protein